MIFEKVRGILCIDDGSLPDINFDFGQARVVDDAYALVQSRATHLTSDRPCHGDCEVALLSRTVQYEFEPSALRSSRFLILQK